MPSKAKPIQMKTTYHVGGSVPRRLRQRKLSNPGDFMPGRQFQAQPSNGGMTPGDTGGQTRRLKRAIGRPKPPKAPIRKMPITSAPKSVKNIGLKKAIGRPKPPKAPIRNMAVTGPKRRTGWGGRSTPRNLRRFR
jgi:hypothetical protein